MSIVLTIGAHPDDETLFAGGFLAKQAADGHRVHILCTTRGEGGEVGDPPVGPREQLGAIREAELRAAARALEAREVVCLDYVDPAMEIGGEARAIDASLEEFSQAIRQHLERLQPDVVVTHGADGEYGHPQHVFTHQAVFEALRQLAPWWPRAVLTWCANDGTNADDRITNQSDPADIVLLVEGTLFDAKLAATLCHRSQHAMFLRNTGKATVAEMVRRKECFRRWG